MARITVEDCLEVAPTASRWCSLQQNARSSFEGCEYNDRSPRRQQRRVGTASLLRALSRWMTAAPAEDRWKPDHCRTRRRSHQPEFDFDSHQNCKLNAFRGHPNEHHIQNTIRYSCCGISPSKVLSATMITPLSSAIFQMKRKSARKQRRISSQRTK